MSAVRPLAYAWLSGFVPPPLPYTPYHQLVNDSAPRRGLAIEDVPKSRRRRKQKPPYYHPYAHKPLSLPRAPHRAPCLPGRCQFLLRVWFPAPHRRWLLQCMAPGCRALMTFSGIPITMPGMEASESGVDSVEEEEEGLALWSFGPESVADESTLQGQGAELYPSSGPSLELPPANQSSYFLPPATGSYTSSTNSYPSNASWSPFPATNAASVDPAAGDCPTPASSSAPAPVAIKSEPEEHVIPARAPAFDWVAHFSNQQTNSRPGLPQPALMRMHETEGVAAVALAPSRFCVARGGGTPTIAIAGRIISSAPGPAGGLSASESTEPC
ncbi:hypothetical protein MIND_01278100 [Mycena indigotica]|uniref:Uncharacterized protein n=1 Tax=Mycena indigotica TaxID=2126181 RepID=A0A8H6S247_9AGAR|nr:uncharacterized protein MIND_01278100 [Mycena indigotica]KAF7291336.1 hypothetical protein MIND_01278100 [Mycena indigotica]